MHVGVMQRSLVSAVKELSIDHAGVGIERNPFCQPIVINAGHHGPLLGHSCLLLDNRGHRDDAVHVFVQANRTSLLAKALHHGREDVLQALGASELIGIRE